LRSRPAGRGIRWRLFWPSDPAVRSRLADLGHEFFPRDQLTPEALAAFQAAEIKKWWPVIKAANIKGE
jgi:hypothetical protein